MAVWKVFLLTSTDWKFEVDLLPKKLGYYKNQEANSATFTRDGWLRTGDIVYFDSDGHLYIVDRLKEMIKVYLRRIYNMVDECK